MTLRSRSKRTARAPAVWRGPLAPPASDESIEHGVRRGSWLGWRAVSGLIVLALLATLVLFFSLDAFYVGSVAVGGVRYMTKGEVLALTGIVTTQGSQHLFWLDPEQIRASILRSPTIADAQVYVGWPPDAVQIIVQEREPALIWEQSGITVWLDLQGRVMRLREDRADLVRIVSGLEGAPPLTSPITNNIADVVAGALQLRDLLPGTLLLRYHPDNGLGYTDAGGWLVWFGSGANMPEKIVIYKAILANLQSRGITPTEVNVSDPDHPYYSTVWGQ